MSTYLRLILIYKYNVYKYRLYYTQCRHTYGVFPSVYTTYIKVVFTILNVVIHTAYSKIAYLCSFSLLLYLLTMSLCGWSSMPAVSSSAQSVTCSHVYSQK